MWWLLPLSSSPCSSLLAAATTGCPNPTTWRKGNAICQKVNDEIERRVRRFPTDRPPTQDEFTKFTGETLIPKIGKEIDDLDKLNPPSELKDEVDKLIASARADYTRCRPTSRPIGRHS